MRNLPDDIPLEELAQYIKSEARQHHHTNNMQHLRYPLHSNQRSFRDHLDFLLQRYRNPLDEDLNLLQKQNIILNYIQKLQHHKSLPYFGLDTVFDQYRKYPHFKVK